MLSAETEQRLQEAAERQGKDVDTFVDELLRQNFATAPRPIAPPPRPLPALSEEEIDRGYDTLAALIERCQMSTGIPKSERTVLRQSVG